jgi:DNA-binding response OmpR family regulator
MFIHDADKEIQPLIILHVEDEAMVADTVKEILEMEGWAVETCREATHALKLLQGETHYDVLIFDNKLPDVSGVELIRRARQMPHRQHTPIIMLSASDIEKEARRAGATAFLKKPDDMHAIAETIAQLLARKSKHRGKLACPENQVTHWNFKPKSRWIKRWCAARFLLRFSDRWALDQEIT